MQKCTHTHALGQTYWHARVHTCYQRHPGRRSPLITFSPPPLCPAKADGEGGKRNKSLLGNVSLLYRSLRSFHPLPLHPLSFSPSPFVILGVCLPSSSIESGCTSERTITHISLGWAVTGCEGKGVGGIG